MFADGNRDLWATHLDLSCRRTVQLLRILAAVPNGTEAAALERLQSDLVRIEDELAEIESLVEGRPPPLVRLPISAGAGAEDVAVFGLAVAWALFPEAPDVLLPPGTDRELDVGLALRLTCPTTKSRILARRLFAADAPLVRAGLIDLVPTPGTDIDGRSELLRTRLVVPEHVLMALAGESGLPVWLRDRADLVEPSGSLDDAVLDADDRSRLLALLARWRKADGDAGAAAGTPTLVLAGSAGSGKTFLAGALAASLKHPLLRVRMPALARSEEPAGRVWPRLVAIARFFRAVLLLDDVDPGTLGNGLADTLAACAEDGLPVVVTVPESAAIAIAGLGFSMIQVALREPSHAMRHALWRRALAAEPDAPALPAESIDLLARQFRFDAGQIREAVRLGLALPDGAVSGTDAGAGAGPEAPFVAAGRALLAKRLDRYSVRVPTNLTLADIVLRDEQREQLAELVAACRNRAWVFEHWGFARRIATGQGITALFDGEPGTGKTLAATILAATLDLPLYRISLGQVVDKYVGETEKHIEHIFRSAHAAQAILLFDEADALFTRRVKVDSSMDRFSNLQTNTLLQEIEAYNGIVLLTTNLECNIDPAFQRRIHFRVRFPFPDAAERARIWRMLTPPEAPIDADVDFDDLGARYEISGGYIRNAVLRAAYRARERGTAIGSDLLDAVARLECRTAGKLSRDRPAGDDWR